MTTPTRLNVHTRQSFVRSTVKEVPLTTRIIDAVMPYFPRNTCVISGYLDDSDQYWKANWHWEYLVKMIDKSLKKSMSEHHQKCAKAISGMLMTNPPKPQTGYVTSSKVGRPNDSSDRPTIIKRWRTVRQCKRDFKLIVNKAGLLDAQPPPKTAWHLAVAPVASPGTSKHGSGYAIDISGDNMKVKAISNGLVASLVFDEKSHVHVEFANGVKAPEYRAAMASNVSRQTDGSAVVTSARHDLSFSEMAELLTAGLSGKLQGEIPFVHIIRSIFQGLL